VNLEPLFASLIKREDYMVFLTPGANSNGLYVSRQDAMGFDVAEQNGGKSSLTFAYRVVSRRKDIPGQRLARVDSSTARSTVRQTAPPPPNLPANAYGPSFGDFVRQTPRYTANGNELPFVLPPAQSIPQPQPLPQQPQGTQPGSAPQPSPSGQTPASQPPSPNAPSGPPSIAGN
jgi:hypothetical protein